MSSSYTLRVIGYVAVSVRGNTIRLRFTGSDGIRRQMSVAKNSEPGVQKAIAIGKVIDRDIVNNCYDESLCRYKMLLLTYPHL